jgi:ribosome-binding factor A
MATDVKRSVRLSARVAKELAWALGRDVRDPRVADVTVTRVEMPDDLRTARVYVRLLSPGAGQDEELRRSALVGLSRASGLLRKTIASRLGLRVTPELKFFYDEGLDDVTRIEMLLEEVHAEERTRTKKR